MPDPEPGLLGRRIVIIEDEADIAEIVRTALEGDGATVDWFADGRVGFDAVRAAPPDLVVLDMMLPTMSGLEILRSLRSASEIPVLVLSAVADVNDRVTGLDLGADDYLPKPFSPRELVARARSVLRRRPDDDRTGTTITDRDLVIDPALRQVRRGEKVIDLTAREFDLLHHLARNPGRVHSREELLREVWSSSPDWQDAATVTEHVRRVRHKIGDDDPPRIVTVRGVGYRFEPAT